MAEQNYPFRSHPFWEFSLKVYADDSVKKACLDLQDQFALNVNILLYCAWLAADKGILLNEQAFNTIAGTVSAWHNKVEKVREIRRDLSNMGSGDVQVAPQAIQKVKNIEIASEYIEQTLLASIKLPRHHREANKELALRQNFLQYLRFEAKDDLNMCEDLACKLAPYL